MTTMAMMMKCSQAYKSFKAHSRVRTRNLYPHYPLLIKSISGTQQSIFLPRDFFKLNFQVVLRRKKEH